MAQTKGSVMMTEKEQRLCSLYHAIGTSLYITPGYPADQLLESSVGVALPTLKSGVWLKVSGLI
jgi:hypothetical protein